MDFKILCAEIANNSFFISYSMEVIIYKGISFVALRDEDNFCENCVDNVFKREVPSCFCYSKKASTIVKWGC